MSAERIYLDRRNPADVALVRSALPRAFSYGHRRCLVLGDDAWVSHGDVSVVNIGMTPVQFDMVRGIVIGTRRIRRHVSRARLAQWRRDRAA